jgi:integrase
MTRPRTRDKHLPRCVYQRHGAYWYVKGGKWTRLGADLRAALATYATLYDAPKGTMPQLIADALRTIVPNVKPSTARQYTTAGRKLSKMLVEFSPADVKQRDVAGLKLALSATPNMANRCISLLRQVFAYAVEQQLVETNPVVGVARLTEAKRKRLISPAEYAAIYAKAGERLQIIMDLAAYTGQRIGDVLSIRETQIGPKGIAFCQQKTESAVTVEWKPGLRAAVDRARSLQGGVRTLTLLSGRTGRIPDYRTVRDQWEKACKAAKVEDAHLHDLRAMSATTARREGKDATALMGHKSASQTARYLRDRDTVLVDGPSYFGPSIDSASK